MRPFSPHTRFFSSLDQLHQRLSSEQNPNPNPNPSSNQEASLSSSPLYLTYTTSQRLPFSSSSSGPPIEFLSNPPSPTNTYNHHHHHHQTQQEETKQDIVDDIESLIELLGHYRATNYNNLSSCDSSGLGQHRGGGEGAEVREKDEEIGRLDRAVYRAKKTKPARLAH